MVRNNIFAMTTGYGLYTHPFNSGGSADPIGWQTTFAHNTFWSPTGEGVLAVDDNAQAFPAGTDCTLRDNVVVGEVTIGRWLTSWAHNTTMDYNLYRSSPEGIREFSVRYSLSSWQSYYGQDAASVSGAPTFATTPDPLDPSTFALAPTSLGVGAASDGTDMGADVSRVGPAGL
jgi:hypothetical protein